MGNLIDLINISKSFDGALVLDDLNLSVKENTFVTLLQPFGSSEGSNGPTRAGLFLTGRTSQTFPPISVS